LVFKEKAMIDTGPSSLLLLHSNYILQGLGAAQVLKVKKSFARASIGLLPYFNCYSSIMELLLPFMSMIHNLLPKNNPVGRGCGC
jgi:hypothetical protein